MHACNEKEQTDWKIQLHFEGNKRFELTTGSVERLCRFPLEVLTFGVPVGRRLAVRMLDLGIPLGLGVLL